MGARKRRRTDRALRPPMRSPGRPPGWRREHRLRFWDEIARGLSSEEPGHDNLAYVPCTSDTAQPDMGGPHITKPLCVKWLLLDAWNETGGSGQGCRFGGGPGWLC